ncbi:MAG: chemotaxis protein CheX [Planctomycetota bacterium]
MQVEHINPFLGAISNTFSTMLGAEVPKRGQLVLGDPKVRTYPISGIIGLSGNAIGTVVINLSNEVALRAASALLLEEKSEIDDDVLDAVGELANVVAGQAKSQLEEFNLSISLPNVVHGEGHVIRFPGTKPLCVPFETDLGPLRLEVGFETMASGASAEAVVC